MRTLGRDRVIYAFSKDAPPALTIDSGETVRMATLDCYSGALSETGQDWLTRRTSVPGPNPATGPVAVRGARPGDALKAEILSIETAGFGIMNTRPGVGALARALSAQNTRRFPIADGRFDFFGMSLPVAPMIGVIGVAPPGAAIGCDTPGAHGGNMDTRLIAAGSTLYLPVACEGALFALGDVHAQMGDGEVAICGLECAADVTVRLSVLPGRAPAWPVLVTDEQICVLCSAKTLDEAAEIARYALFDFLGPRTALDAEQRVLLLSLMADLAVCQVVDPLVTVRMGLRRQALPALDF